MAKRKAAKPKAKSTPSKSKAKPKPKPKPKGKKALGKLWEDDDKTLPIDEIDDDDNFEDEIIEGEEEIDPNRPTYDKRFVAGLQSEADPCCFSFFADSNDINQLMKISEAKVNTIFNRKKKQLGVHIHDREHPIVSYRYNLPDINKRNAFTQIQKHGRSLLREVFAEEPVRLKEWIKDS